jgi:hypothetical protein
VKTSLPCRPPIANLNSREFHKLKRVQIVQAVQWFDRSRSLTAGFLDGLQFRAWSRNHRDRRNLPLILKVVEGFARFKTFPEQRQREELPRCGNSRNVETLENREACRERVKRLRKLDSLAVDSPF